MIPRSLSIKKFSRNYPRSLSTANFIVNYRPADKTKIIITISKKTCPLAVDRNRSRRLVASCFMELNQTISPPKEIAILVKSNLSKFSQNDIKPEISKILLNF